VLVNNSQFIFVFKIHSGSKYSNSVFLVVLGPEVIQARGDNEHNQVSGTRPDREFTGHCRHVNEVHQVRGEKEVSKAGALQGSRVFLDCVQGHPSYTLFVFLALLTPNSALTVTVDFHQL